ncbi:hypothetical protein CLAFUW4_07459 [Fulvia fulva]|nr:hypothetical protein CLAFUR4_07466 [Fulvia fulva]KAK4623367.1 hypothetical protein CLAFUR0_07465 [Fulvia fulva]WPV16298.1 hypothetical protein CLAFUW4_07459 [Fulvia fulva]
MRSSLHFQLLLAFTSYCAASPRWSNTSAPASTLRVNIKPPQSILPGNNYATHTATPTYNYFSEVASYASTTHASAVYGNTTFASVCLTAPQKEASDCYETCKSFASMCRSDHWDWDNGNNAYQSSMNSKYNGGTSKVITEIVETHSDRLKTSWAYETSWRTECSTSTVLGSLTSGTYLTSWWTFVNGKFTGFPTIATHHPFEVYTTSVPYAIGQGTVVSVKTPDNYLITSTQFSQWPYSKEKPSCSPTSWLQCSYSQDCNKCTISGGTVQLLYFPVTRTTGSTQTTAPATLKTEVATTAIYENTTLTSGSVYISFNSAYADNACGTPVGRGYPGAILAMDPKSLKSINMGWGTMYGSVADPFALPGASKSAYLVATSFNLEDLQWPVPETAYQQQPKCQNGPFGKCSVILDDYNPLLEVPEQIRNLDPAWKTCELDWEGLYDPPIAVQPASTVVKPSAGDPQASYTSAEPAGSITSIAVETKPPISVPWTNVPAASSDTPAETSGREQTSATSQAVPASTERPRSSRTDAWDSPSEPAITTRSLDAPGSAASPEAGSQPNEPVGAPLNPPGQSASSLPAVISTGLTPPAGQIEDPASPTSVGSPENSAQGPDSPVVDPSDGGSAVTQPFAIPQAPTTEHSDPAGSASNVQPGNTAADPASGSQAASAEHTTVGQVITIPQQPAGPDQAAPGVAASRTTLLAAIGTQTVTASGAAQTISGQVISLGESGLVFGTKTIGIPQNGPGTQSLPIPNVGSSALAVTFFAGPVTQPAALGTHTTLKAAQGAVPTHDKVFTLGTKTYTASRPGPSGEAVIGTLSMTAGGSALTLNVGTVSLAPNYDLILADDGTSSASAESKSTLNSGIPQLVITLDNPRDTYLHRRPAIRYGVCCGGWEDVLDWTGCQRAWWDCQFRY